MDSFGKKKNSIIVSIHISPPKVTRISVTFLKERGKKASPAPHLKDTYTIKCVLTSVRYVETELYINIYFIFSFSMPEGEKKNLHIKPLPSEVFRKKKKKLFFKRREVGRKRLVKKRKIFKSSWTSI